MSQLSLFKNFTKAVTATVITITTFSIGLTLGSVNPLNVQAISPLSAYEQRKADIKSKQEEIDKQLKDVNVDFEGATSRKSSLSAERKAKEEEVNKIKNAIEIIDLVSKKIQEQIDQYNKELKVLEGTQAEIYNELWIDSRIPFLAKVLNRSIIESFEAGKKLKNLEEEATKITEEIRLKNQQLQDQLEEQKKLKSQWQGAQAIVDTKVSGLNYLIEQVQNDESKYTQLMKTLDDQKKAGDAELERAGIDYKKQAEEITKKNQEAQKAGLYQPNNLIPNNNRPGYIGCGFEANNLNAPNGFFGPVVSNGTYNQSFHCGHDGMDIGGAIGTPLYALADGIVIQANRSPSWNYGAGNYIVIEMTVPSGQKVLSNFLHMQSPTAFGLGSFVKKGQEVGRIGMTGNTTGPHVHFMLIEGNSGGNFFCSYSGGAKCYNPARYLNNVIG